MVQTQKYMQQLADKGFKSMEQGNLDHIINIQNQAGNAFKMELMPRSKTANIIGPNNAVQKVRYSNMGDFASKSADFINNWK